MENVMCQGCWPIGVIVTAAQAPAKSDLHCCVRFYMIFNLFVYTNKYIYSTALCFQAEKRIFVLSTIRLSACPTLLQRAVL